MVLAELPHPQYVGEELPARWRGAGIGARAGTGLSYDVDDFPQASHFSDCFPIYYTHCFHFTVSPDELGD